MPDNPSPPDIYEKTPDFFQPIQLDLHATDSAMGREETDQSAVCGQELPFVGSAHQTFERLQGSGSGHPGIVGWYSSTYG